MSYKHTPWRAHGIDVLGEEPDKLLPSPVIHRGERDELDPGLIETEQLANARLIAAAPTMAEALGDAAELLRNGASIHPGSDVAQNLLAALGVALGR